MRMDTRRQSMTVMARPSVAGRTASEEWKPFAPIAAGWYPPDTIADSPNSASRKAEEITRGAPITTTDTCSRVSTNLTFTVAIYFIATFLLSISGRRITVGHMAGG